ncbi:MAG: ATP-binding protein [Deltaproteobacteria bacterium]|nr:ATP-binding protein [Deltaproteobacteria bacterium]
MVTRPNEILDREAEWGVLEDLWGSAQPELVFVLGRRRVGKSFVLSRFARAVGGVYYQATRRTEAEQLIALSAALGERFDDAALRQGAGLPSWEALFGYLREKAGEEPFFVVLDEFPFLSSAAPALTSIIQQLWDHEWADTQIKLVLSGSYVTAMLQLEAGDQPLFGRRTRRLRFEPFLCRDLEGFVPSWSAADRMRLYGTVGQLPGHLALVDRKASLRSNVARLMLESSGRLVDEAQHMLDTFLGEADVHYSILEAIARGDQTWSRITSRIGKSGGAVSRPLHWLEQMSFIERVVPITEKAPSKSKRAIYRIADPHVRFWHRFVAPAMRSGSLGLVSPAKLYDRAVKPNLDDHMGPVFEQICTEHARSSGAPFEPFRVGPWWDAKGRNEVDVVSISADDEVFVAECKWGRIKLAHLAELRERAQLVVSELPRVARVHLGLYSGRGSFDAKVLRAAEDGEVQLFGPDDVLG